MKKIMITAVLLSLKIYAQEYPTQIETPYYVSGEAELIEKGYSSTPQSTPTQKLYVPDFTNSSSKIVESMEKKNNLSDNNEGTLEKIANYQNDKIDISGGYVKASEVYNIQDDGTLTPKYDVYKPGVDNKEYNIALKKQENANNVKMVKTNSKEILPLIFLLVGIVTLVYLIIFLHKKIRNRSF